MSTNVQALTIALFGAYAGGYTADIQARVDAWGLTGAADSLVGFQQPLLGVSLSDNAAWIDVLLGNVGIDSTNAAYTEAQAWAAAQLSGGASRGAVAAAAVEYLLGDAVAPAFASIATAFAADAAAGETYSATTAGAAEFGIGALRVAAGNTETGTSFNLTAALADLTAANEAVDAYVTAWGEANDVDPVVAGDIGSAVVTAEDALDDALTAQGFANYDAVEATIGASDAVEDAYLNLANTSLAATRTSTAATLTTATTALNAVSTSLKAAVDAAVAASTAASDAADAETAAENALTGAQTQFALDNAFTTTEQIAVLAAGVLTLVNDADNDTVIDAGETIASFDGTTWTDGDATPAATAALKTAAEAYYAAVEASDAADAQLVATLQVVEGLDADQTTAANVGAVTVGTSLFGESATYATAVSTLATLDADLAEIAELSAAVDAARGDYEGLSALEDAQADAVAAIEDQGYVVSAVANGVAEVATVDADVFTISALEDGDNVNIFNFGVTGNDLIVASGYVQGADIDAGDDTALEFFVEQSGANTVVTFETAKFGSSAAGLEAFTVTLMGVDAADVTFANGQRIQPIELMI